MKIVVIQREPLGGFRIDACIRLKAAGVVALGQSDLREVGVERVPEGASPRLIEALDGLIAFLKPGLKAPVGAVGLVDQA